MLNSIDTFTNNSLDKNKKIFREVVGDTIVANEILAFIDTVVDEKIKLSINANVLKKIFKNVILDITLITLNEIYEIKQKTKSTTS